MSEGRRPFVSGALAIATLFGAGRSPIAPGTAGTLAALPLAFAAGRCLPPWGFALATALLAALGVWAAGVAAPVLGSKDPGARPIRDALPVTVDEAAGLFVTLLGIPPGSTLAGAAGTLAAAFVLFRAMDVIKPAPARQAEGLPGGWGIVVDDLIAGVYANLGLRLLLFLSGRLATGD